MITDKSQSPILPVSGSPPAQFSAHATLSRAASWEGWLPLAIFITFALVMGAAQFSTPGLAGTDGYYHIRMADLMRREGLTPEFTYLPQTVLNQREFYDHHFLFHAALIPFTWFGLILGAKLAAVIFASLAFLAVWWLLKGQKVPYAALWALGLLAVSDAFLYRMSLPRAQSLSLAVLAVGLHWMLTGKHRLLLPLGFVYVWLYNAFPLLPALAVLYTLAAWAIEGRLNIRPVVYASLGVALGLVINPYFPQDIIFIVRHFLPKLSDATAVSVGNEWYPYTTQQLLENSFLSVAALFSGMLALGMSKQRMQVGTATLLLTAGLFALMLMQARRFIEYFPAFSLAFAALAWSDWVRSIQNAPAQDPLPTHRWQLLKRLSYPLLLTAIFAFGAWNSILRLQDSLQASQPPQRYAAASAWLSHSTPQGSLVFQTDWDDFTRLFFHNTHNSYLVGLDPTYLQLADSERLVKLYDLWVEISAGKIENPSELIASRFGASYVFTDTRHQEFLEMAAADGGMREVYRDPEAVIFHITP